MGLISRLKLDSLAQKITFLIIFVTVVALVASHIVILLFAFSYEKEELLEETSAVVSLVGENATAAILYDDKETLNQMLSSLSHMDSIMGAFIFNKAGNQVGQFLSMSHSHQAFVEQLPHQINHDAIGDEMSLFSFLMQDYFVVEKPVSVEERVVGTIKVIYGLQEFKQDLKDSFYVLIATLLFVGGLAYLLAFRFATRLLKPINELKTATDNLITTSDFSLRVEKTTNDEIGAFTEHFNAMLDEIQARGDGLERVIDELTVARDEAEKASLAKSEFLSRMSHEFRTPMNAILGFAQLLEYEDLTRNQDQNVNEILKAGNHLLDLINQLLEISKIESGNIELEIETVDIEASMNDCLAIIKPMVDEKLIEIQSNITDSQDVLADRTALKQTFINILSNAVKYNVDGGTVIIEMTHNDDNYVEISITDTGIGIEADSLDKVFMPFDRLHQKRYDIEGTGIGLAITKHIVEKMNGEIGVESESEVGSRFWIRLPKSELDNMSEVI
jgi:signal transduction histidine kinase